MRHEPTSTTRARRLRERRSRGVVMVAPIEVGHPVALIRPPGHGEPSNVRHALDQRGGVFVQIDFGVAWGLSSPLPPRWPRGEFGYFKK